MKRTVSVVGSATVSVDPDCARLSCGVQVTGVNAQDALARSNEVMAAILGALRERGIDAGDLRTNGPNLYPTDRGYHGSNDVTVTVRDIGSVAAVIDAVAGSAGPNLTIHGVTFSVSDPAPHMRAARLAAMEAARSIADELAGAAGTSVGEVLTINESSGYQSPVPVARGMMKLADTSVEVGSQQLRIDVNVTYRLV